MAMMRRIYPVLCEFKRTLAELHAETNKARERNEQRQVQLEAEQQNTRLAEELRSEVAAQARLAEEAREADMFVYSGMVRLAARSISSSASTNRAPTRVASLRPIVLLPAPIMPTSATVRVKRFKLSSKFGRPVMFASTYCHRIAMVWPCYSRGSGIAVKRSAKGRLREQVSDRSVFRIFSGGACGRLRWWGHIFGLLGYSCA